MSDIFISYASEDKEKAGLLAKVLEQQGWSVWWDKRIPAGKTFAEVIAEALDSSKCVVVLWSKASIASNWVQTEASEGLNRKILIPALIEEVKIPLEFRRIQAIQLVDWQGQKNFPEVNKLIEDVEVVLGIPRKVKREAKRVEEKKTEDETLKQESKKPNAVDEQAKSQPLPVEKVEPKPMTTEKTETGTSKQVYPKHKPEAVDKKKPQKEQGVGKTSTSAKKSRLIWLLPSILVPFIAGMVVLGIYLSNSQKSVTKEEIIKPESSKVKTVTPTSVHEEEVFEKPGIPEDSLSEKTEPIGGETVRQTSVHKEEVFEKPDTPEDSLSEKTEDSKPSTKTKKPEPIVNETVKAPDVPETEIIEQPAITKTRFRSTPVKQLTYESVESMLKDKGFFDYNLNKSATGFPNDYELQNDGKVVFDRASGLMWQQSGSAKYISYDKAKKYVAQLNSDQFARYNDWRLPTLEEAMSLMEPYKKKGDLYIDPLFDKIQGWIWTSDLYSASHAWVVGFDFGSCSSYGFGSKVEYVRAVR